MNTPSHRSLVYLGWLGHQNFGDDLLHATWQRALDRPLDCIAPLHRRDYARSPLKFLAQRFRMRGSERLVLLGGGTTIGFDSWAYHLGTAARAFGAAGAVVPGAGAAESTDAHALGLQRTNWPAWRALTRTALLGVRGPLTAAECAQHWRPTEVLGDPALLYPLLMEPRPRPLRRTTIGVCVGSDPTSRFDPAVVARAVESFAAERGLESVTVFRLSPDDRDAVDALVDQFSLPVRTVAYTGDIDTVMREIGACSAFVSERLHGAVASVALGVPTVPLSYASKCDDFWLSVTGSRSPVTVGHSEDELLQAMRAASADASILAVRSRVVELQEKLQRSVALLRNWLAGDLDTSKLMNDEVRP
ncbi:polysaccharide pyruvyl transferase family protein [Leucobacter iarius]|uniref:Polysaccharide pyruvyl transferase domain-containing protein n=1 Tax=Leucobacter iarius TaxID=333963 RepID=A0ABP4Y387_9MICO